MLEFFNNPGISSKKMKLNILRGMSNFDWFYYPYPATAEILVTSNLSTNCHPI